MASTILSDNGVSSGSAGIKTTADGTGALALQTTTAGGAATTALTISTAQVVTLANALPVASGGTGTTSTTFVNLATNVTGTLPVANGGTGVTTSTGSGAVVLGTSPTLTTPTINSAQVATVSGTAPLYFARAWVNFNGTGTVAIRASGNVSSITDNGTGDYTVNFTTAMSDTSYCGVALPNDGTPGTNLVIACENSTRTKTTSAFNIWTAYGGNGVNKALYDVNTVNVSIFR